MSHFFVCGHIPYEAKQKGKNLGPRKDKFLLRRNALNRSKDILDFEGAAAHHCDASRPAPTEKEAIGDNLSATKQNRLESWKEIAAYLQREVRTVQRWERKENLPIHRHRHQKGGTVYAFTKEIDQWRRLRSLEPGSHTNPWSKNLPTNVPSLRLKANSVPGSEVRPIASVGKHVPLSRTKPTYISAIICIDADALSRQLLSGRRKVRTAALAAISS